MKREQLLASLGLTSNASESEIRNRLDELNTRTKAKLAAADEARMQTKYCERLAKLDRITVELLPAPSSDKQSFNDSLVDAIRPSPGQAEVGSESGANRPRTESQLAADSKSVNSNWSSLFGRRSESKRNNRMHSSSDFKHLLFAGFLGSLTALILVSPLYFRPKQEPAIKVVAGPAPGVPTDEERNTEKRKRAEEARTLAHSARESWEDFKRTNPLSETAVVQEISAAEFEHIKGEDSLEKKDFLLATLCFESAATRFAKGTQLGGEVVRLAGQRLEFDAAREEVKLALTKYKKSVAGARSLALEDAGLGREAVERLKSLEISPSLESIEYYRNVREELSNAADELEKVTEQGLRQLLGNAQLQIEHFRRAEKELAAERSCQRIRRIINPKSLREVYGNQIIESDCELLEGYLTEWRFKPNLLSEMLQEAEQFLERNRFDEAGLLLGDLIYVAQTGQSECENALMEFSERVENRNLASARYTEMGKEASDVERKRSYYSRAVELDPSNAEAFNGLAWVYNEIGEFEQGIKYSTEAISLNGLEASFYFERVFAYNQRGEYDLMINDCSNVLRYEPGNVEAMRKRGLAYYRKNQLESALKDLTEAIRLEPGKADDWQFRGSIYFELGEYESARSDFEAAHRLKPSLKTREWLERIASNGN